MRVTTSLNADLQKKNELGKPPIPGLRYISQVCKIRLKQNFYVENWREIQKFYMILIGAKFPRIWFAPMSIRQKSKEPGIHRKLNLGVTQDLP